MTSFARILSITFVALFSSFSIAAPMKGDVGGQDFSFNFDETFNEIQGRWGNLNYNFSVDKTFFEIQGTVANKPVNMSFDKTFREVTGTTPCGSIRLEYNLTFKEVTGTVCGARANLSFGDVNDVLPAYADLSISTITETFPVPVRAQVSRFIMKRFPFLSAQKAFVSRGR